MWGTCRLNLCQDDIVTWQNNARCTLGETGPKETGNLLNERLRRQERIVLFCELFDKLFVLIESREV